MSTAVVKIGDSAFGRMSALAVRLGERGLLRFLEFFAVHIRNRNTRAAYVRAARTFLLCG
jgi:hypothetical protein